MFQGCTKGCTHIRPHLVCEVVCHPVCKTHKQTVGTAPGITSTVRTLEWAQVSARASVRAHKAHRCCWGQTHLSCRDICLLCSSQAPGSRSCRCASAHLQGCGVAGNGSGLSPTSGGGCSLGLLCSQSLAAEPSSLAVATTLPCPPLDIGALRADPGSVLLSPPGEALATLQALSRGLSPHRQAASSP